MEQDSKKDLAYLLAKHRAEKLKRFYLHSIIYLLLNPVIMAWKVIQDLNNGADFNEAFFNFNAFSTAIIWGLVLAIHAFSVFGPNVILGNDWEERKLKQYMREEEEQINN